MGTRNLDEKLHQHSQRSLLWTHGGHPILPVSAEWYNKQQLFLDLCELVWSTKANPYKQGMAIAFDQVCFSFFPLPLLSVSNASVKHFLWQKMILSRILLQLPLLNFASLQCKVELSLSFNFALI